VKLERRERSPKASVSLAGDVSNPNIVAKRTGYNYGDNDSLAGSHAGDQTTSARFVRTGHP
jgi:hypothetical protein